MSRPNGAPVNREEERFFGRFHLPIGADCPKQRLELRFATLTHTLTSLPPPVGP